MRRLTVAAIFVIALAGTALLLLSSRRKPATVRIAYPPIAASLPVFIAEEKHLFEDQRLQLSRVPFGNSNDMVNALVAGQIDILPAVSLVPIVHLELQHPGRVRVFAHSRMNPTNALDKVIVKENSPLQRLEDLRGKKLGVFAGTAPTRMFGVFMRKHGVDPQTVTFVQLPVSAQLSSLESGAVDALFSYEPVTTTALVQGGYRELYGSVYADLLNPCPLGVSVIAREFERQRPREASKAVEVVQQGVAFMKSNPAEARALLPKFTKMPREIASRVNVADVTLSNEVDVANLQRFIDLLFESGEIPQKIDAHRLVEPTK